MYNYNSVQETRILNIDSYDNTSTFEKSKKKIKLRLTYLKTRSTVSNEFLKSRHFFEKSYLMHPDFHCFFTKLIVDCFFYGSEAYIVYITLYQPYNNEYRTFYRKLCFFSSRYFWQFYFTFNSNFSVLEYLVPRNKQWTTDRKTIATRPNF